MWQRAMQDGRVPWRRQALSAVALMTLAVAGERPTVLASGGDLETGRMACDAPRPPVRLHLVDRAGLSIDTRDALMRETLAPWRRLGADIAWAAQMPSRPLRLGEPRDLYVFVEPDDDRAAADTTLPLASILFVQGQASTHITVHAGHVVRRLAALHLDDRPIADAPRLLRDRILGRVLGRAVAHEVGHFFSGSREHAGTGLMRAGHRMEHLLASGHPAFEVATQATPGCLIARSGEQP